MKSKAQGWTARNSLYFRIKNDRYLPLRISNLLIITACGILSLYWDTITFPSISGTDVVRIGLNLNGTGAELSSRGFSREKERTERDSVHRC